MQKEVVSKEIMQELIVKLEEIVNNYCWNLEPFSDEDINSFFDGTEEEVTYYKSLIVDSIESTSFLWSSKKIAEEIAKAIIESSEYTNNLIKNMSSIRLKYVTSLPTSEISKHTIYILKASEGSSKDTLNLYNEIDGWTSIGDFSISLDDYYDKTEVNTKLDLKANKTEVISNDKIVQTLDSTNATDQIPSAKAVYDSCIKDNNIKTYTSVTQLGLSGGCSVSDIFNSLPNNSILKTRATTTSGHINEVTDIPYTQGILLIDKYDTTSFSIQFKRSTSGSVSENDFYIGQLKGVDGSGLTWSRVCTTTVADVDKTLITTQNLLTGSISYYIKNGLCYVSVSSITPNSDGGLNIGATSSLPNPDTKGNNHHVVGSTSGVMGLFIINTDGSITFYGKNTLSYFGQFSYPVAE